MRVMTFHFYPSDRRMCRMHNGDHRIPDPKNKMERGGHHV